MKTRDNTHDTERGTSSDEETPPESAPMHLIEELQRYMDFGPADVEHLVELGPRVSDHFEGLVESFYGALEENPRTRAVFEDEAQLMRLRHSLGVWVSELFEGTYDEAYYAKRMHIGRVHVRVGLAPHFVSGAMNILRRGLEEAVREVESDPGELSEHLGSVQKLIDIELSLMHQSYWDNLMEQKLRVPQALAMGLAHEIRNPLNGIGLNLTLLERRMRSMDEGEEFKPLIEVIRQEVRRIGGLTSEIMDFAKPIEVQQGWVDTDNLLATLRSVHEPTLSASNIEFVTEHQGLGKMWADRDRLLQVFTNLITNAAEAIEEGGTIRVSIDNDEAHTTIEVSDDGKGMDPALKYRVFELFFTDKISGTGLGLPIVRKIVEAHQGSVDLTTKPDRGTTFTLFLPRREQTS